MVMLQCPCTCTARIRLEELTTSDTINKSVSMLRFIFVPSPRFSKKPRDPVGRPEMATWVKGGYGMDYSGGRAPGYYPSVWPVECGGPRRQKLAASRGLNIQPGNLLINLFCFFFLRCVHLVCFRTSDATNTNCS